VIMSLVHTCSDSTYVMITPLELADVAAAAAGGSGSRRVRGSWQGDDRQVAA